MFTNSLSGSLFETWKKFVLTGVYYLCSRCGTSGKRLFLQLYAQHKHVVKKTVLAAWLDFFLFVLNQDNCIKQLLKLLILDMTQPLQHKAVGRGG